VQAARNLVGSVIKLTARMQMGHVTRPPSAPLRGGCRPGCRRYR
jgi:hypothetical protein